MKERTKELVLWHSGASPKATQVSISVCSNEDVLQAPHPSTVTNMPSSNAETNLKVVASKPPWLEAVTRRDRLKSNSNAKNDFTNKRSSRDSSRAKTVIGKKVSGGEISWGGAELTMDMYIGRVATNVDITVVREYIEKAGVSVVNFEELPRKHERFKSFKLTLKRSDLTKIRDPEFWPEGVVFRNYFRPHQRTREPVGEPEVREIALGNTSSSPL
jgi:hypothetical protein